MDRLETEINAVRADVHTRWGLVDARFAAMQAQIDARFDAVEQGLISLHTQFTDLHRHMLVLHEDVVDRLSRIRG